MDHIEDLKLDVSQLRRDICEQQNALRQQNDCYLAEKRCGRIVSSLTCLLITLWLITCTVITIVLFTRENFPVGSIMAWIPGGNPPEGDNSSFSTHIYSYQTTFIPK